MNETIIVELLTEIRDSLARKEAAQTAAKCSAADREILSELLTGIAGTRGSAAFTVAEILDDPRAVRNRRHERAPPGRPVGAWCGRRHRYHRPGCGKSFARTRRDFMAGAFQIPRGHSETPRRVCLIMRGDTMTRPVGANLAGTDLTRFISTLCVNRGVPVEAEKYAREKWPDSPAVSYYFRTIVEAGDTTTSGWTSQLVNYGPVKELMTFTDERSVFGVSRRC